MKKYSDTIRPYSKVYTLSIGDDIIYVGKTNLWLITRLSQHVKGNKLLINKYGHCIDKVVIDEVERCNNNAHALKLEKYWIEQFNQWGFDLLNITHKRKNKPKPLKIAYRTLTNKEYRVLYIVGISNIAKIINVENETLRIAIKKRKIKFSYYNNIFLSDNKLINNMLGAAFYRCENLFENKFGTE